MSLERQLWLCTKLDRSKRIFIRLERTQSLVALVRTLRSQFVGESEDALEDFMERFDPHISLAYSAGFCDDQKIVDEVKISLERSLREIEFNAFQFMVLMDTRSKSGTKYTEKTTQWRACPIRLAM